MYFNGKLVDFVLIFVTFHSVHAIRGRCASAFAGERERERDSTMLDAGNYIDLLVLGWCFYFAGAKPVCGRSVEQIDIRRPRL